MRRDGRGEEGARRRRRRISTAVGRRGKPVFRISRRNFHGPIRRPDRAAVDGSRSAPPPLPVRQATPAHPKSGSLYPFAQRVARSTVPTITYNTDCGRRRYCNRVSLAVSGPAVHTYNNTKPGPRTTRVKRESGSRLSRARTTVRDSRYRESMRVRAVFNHFEALESGKKGP